MSLGNVGSHLHAQGRLHAQKRPEKTLHFHLWQIFGPRERRKSRLRQGPKQHSEALKDCQTESICKDWEHFLFSLGSRHSRKSMLKHYVTTSWRNKDFRDPTHNKEYSHYKNSLEKSLNKYTTITCISNRNEPRGGGRIWFLELSH